MPPVGPHIPLAGAAHVIGLISGAYLVIFEFNVKFQSLDRNRIIPDEKTKMFRETNIFKLLIKCHISIVLICTWQPFHLSHQTLN